MYLFSYGSNNPKQLEQRLERNLSGVWPAICFGREKAYRGWSNNWGGGVATLNKKKGQSAYGYVLEVSEVDLKKLDRFEGVRSGNYYRTTASITVYDDEFEDGEMVIECIFYKASSREFNSPSLDYLKANLKTLNSFWTNKGKKFTLKFLKDRIR